MNHDHKSIDHTKIHSLRKKRIHRRSHIIQAFKAKMDEKRTPFERYADATNAAVGSNAFLILNILWFVIWIAINQKVIPSLAVFDPFPFSFLTATVSLEAIILAILVLVSQNRAARIADLREEVHLQIDIIAEEEITKMMEILVMIAEKNNIDLSEDEKLQSMLRPTDPDKIEESIGEQLR